MLDLRRLTPLLSRALGFTIPLLLALHWPVIACHVNAVLMLTALRVALLGASLVLLLIWTGTGTSHSELKWAFVFSGFLVVYLASALCGTHIGRGLQDWIRVATAMFVGFGSARALRHPPTAKAFGVSLIVASLISCGVVLFTYWHYMGFRAPGYESLRIFKESALRGSGVALNPLAGAAFLFCLMGMCMLPSSRILNSIAVFVLIVVGGLTGSRAPIALLVVCGGTLLFIKSTRSRDLTHRVSAWGALLLAVVVVVVTLSLATPYKISASTEGRYDVWTVGWAKFVERPLIGHGPESWRDDLFSRLPGYYKETGALQRLKAGGYHSEYVTLLAEGGLLCFLCGLAVLALLVRESLRVAFHSETRRYRGELIVFTSLFLCVRALIEIPGLFGYGQDVTDYLAYLFVAIVASRTSLLERDTATTRETGAVSFASARAALRFAAP
ncbi:MAG: O-antigen ligase family protein [Bryobacteraceae bacterium]